MCGVFNESSVQYWLIHSSVKCPVEMGSEKRACMASKLKMCIGTKLEKLILIKLF